MEGSANDRLRKNAWRNISFTGMANCLLIVVSLLILADAAFCLRMVMLDVPSAVNHGESVELSCIYELENDRLYSIKWYRNDVEFYRYVPNDWPPGQFLPLPGVRVDLSKSGQRSVYLRSVDLNSTGTYRCEVSAEAPSFQSVEAERDMKVMVLPTEGPKIMGGQTQYNVGDTVAVNCTSAKSKPAATLRWFINDNPVGTEYDTEYSTTLHEDGLESSSLSLRFVAKDKHFVNQNMRLRCTASISRIYTMSNEEMFVGGRQQSSPLQITENGSQEKPLKSPPNPKRKQPKQRTTTVSTSTGTSEISVTTVTTQNTHQKSNSLLSSSADRISTAHSDSVGTLSTPATPSPTVPKDSQSLSVQSSSDGSVFSFCHWLLVLSVLMLHLRIT